MSADDGKTAAPAAPASSGGRFSRSSTGFLAGVLAGGNLVAMALRLAGGMLVARFVRPDDLGLYSGIGLVLVYAAILQAGVINGLNRELPYLIGKGDRARVQSLAATSLGWAVICGVLAGGAALLWGGVQALLGHGQMAAGWMAYAAALFALFVGLYLRSTLRTSAEFGKLAICQVVSAVAAFVLLAGVWKFGYLGLCARLVLFTVAELALLWHWRPVRVRPTLRREDLKHLLAIGVPIFIVGYLYTGWRYLDSTLVFWRLGKEQLGLFQVAVLTMTAGASVTDAMNQVVYPRMAQEYGRTHDQRTILRAAWRPMFLLALGAVPALALGWFLLPPAVAWLMPSYVGGTRAAQWALPVVFLCCFQSSLAYYNVVRKQRAYAVTIVAGALTFVGASFWLVGTAPDSPVATLFRLVGVSLPAVGVASDPLVGYVQAMALGMAVYVLSGNVLAWRLSHAVSVRPPPQAASGGPDPRNPR